MKVNQIVRSFIILQMALSTFSSVSYGAAKGSILCKQLFSDENSRKFSVDAKAKDFYSQRRYQEAIWTWRAAGLEDQASSLEIKVASALIGGRIVSDDLLTGEASGASGGRLIVVEDQDLGFIKAIFKTDLTSSNAYQISLNPFHFALKLGKGLSAMMNLENHFDTGEDWNLVMYQSHLLELSAFTTERLFRFNMDPLTVGRTIRGKVGLPVSGSMQLWIENAKPSAVLRTPKGRKLANPLLFEGPQSELKNSFDYLNAQIDRDENWDNHLIIESEQKLVLPDNGVAFLSDRRQELRRDLVYKLPDAVSFEMLKQLNDVNLVRKLYHHLNEKQIALLHQRIINLTTYFQTHQPF